VGKNLILQNIGKHIQLEDNEKDYFLNLLKERKLKRKQFLAVENDVAFVTKGCLRSYSIDVNGLEHILQFAPVDWWIGNMSNIIPQHTNSLNIDAIEDSEVLLLSRQDQLHLFDKHPKFERFFRILMERALVSANRRMMDILALTAQQRYESFCKYYPSLINQLPQKYIAAYIGVTPEFLSKMKSSVLRNN
jgi:CRP-like cAMP-binding protein